VEVAVPESCVVVGYLGFFLFRRVDLDPLQGRILLLDFLAFCFVHPGQALLHSNPQLLARDYRAVAQGAQPGPGELPMDAAALGRSRCVGAK